MLQLLTPAALWTLAALALPLAIHLWRPPPQTVLLGSLRFLDNLPHRRLRHPRWRELALLATRLALLAALALLVAGPRWQRLPPAGPQRWVLLDPTAAPSGESAERLRQLRTNGYTVHRLLPGLPKVDSLPGQPVAAESIAPPDLWSLLRHADAMLPAGSTLAVFTSGRLAALHGTRPALRHCRVDWIATPDAAGNAARAWLESAERLPPVGERDTPARVVVGTSNARSTRFATASLPPANGLPPGGVAVELAPDHRRARLAQPAFNGGWTPVTPANFQTGVAILHDPDRAEDARYVAAAVRAVAAAEGRPLVVSVRTLDDQPAPAPPDATGWVIWLSARPLPDRAVGLVKNVLRDAEAEARDAPATTAGWIVPMLGTPGATAAAVGLWRRTPAPADPNTETVLTDASGEPLLTLSRANGEHHWAFHSRFHPDWTDLPRTAALAAFLRDLLFPPPPVLPADPAHDLRLADPSQYSLSLSAAPAPARLPASAAVPESTDLHWPLWLLAVLLFAAERLLSRRAAPRTLPAAPTPVTAAAR